MRYSVRVICNQVGEGLRGLSNDLTGGADGGATALHIDHEYDGMQGGHMLVLTIKEGYCLHIGDDVVIQVETHRYDSDGYSTGRMRNKVRLNIDASKSIKVSRSESIQQQDEAVDTHSFRREVEAGLNAAITGELISAGDALRILGAPARSAMAAGK